MAGHGRPTTLTPQLIEDLKTNLHLGFDHFATKYNMTRAAVKKQAYNLKLSYKTAISDHKNKQKTQPKPANVNEKFDPDKHVIKAAETTEPLPKIWIESERMYVEVPLHKTEQQIRDKWANRPRGF